MGSLYLEICRWFPGIQGAKTDNILAFWQTSRHPGMVCFLWKSRS